MLLKIIEGRLDPKELETADLNPSDLEQELSSLRDRDAEPLARALSSALRHGQIVTDHDGARKLVSLITTLFLAPQPQPPAASSQKAAAHALDALTSLTAAGHALAPADLIRVTAHTNPDDPWTSPDAITPATSILEPHIDTPQKLHGLIKSDILESYLRPLFSRSRSERITATGRKAHFPAADAGRGEDLTEDKSSPWKRGDVHAVTVFGWAVDRSDEQLIQEAWPLYVPVLLALLDDADTKYRVRGLRIARAFLAKCPGSRLRDTGLGDILAESIMPTFNFLPSLTPEDESVALLDAAFPAIIQLARSQFGRPEDTAGKRALMGKLLRDGIFTGYWHANQYVRVVEVLARHSATVVDELGLATTPYLKDLIPMYAEILSDPFLVRFSGSLLAAARGLKTTMRNCWPRASSPSHQGEILKALTVGWLSLHEDDGSPRDERQKAADEELRGELTEAARMLAAISSAAGVDLASQTSQLCAKDGSLSGLFAPSVSG